MKVLVVYHSGLVDESRAIYRQYVKLGIDLSVIVPSRISIDEVSTPLSSKTYGPEYDEPGYRFYPVDLRKPHSYGEGFKFFQLLKAIKEAKPDIIHVYDEYSSFYLTQVLICRNILFRKVPVIAYASQNIAFKSPPFIYQFSLRFFKRILRKILQPIAFAYHKKYLNGFTACNTEAIKIIRDTGAKMPARLTPWGVELNVFHPEDRNLCRERIGIPKDIKLIGYIGRLAKEKGLDKLVKAVAPLDYCLLLPKEGPYKEELNKLIDSLGMKERVYHYDKVKYEELGNYYNSFDVFVLPSETTPDWKEQFGIVLVEAMGCHLPIIGSSSGAIPEVLSPYPKHLIFQEGNVEDLREKIKQIDSLRFPEGFDVNKVLYRYSIENFISSYVKFYKELL